MFNKYAYRVEKQNLQVAKIVNFEHVNENMVKDSSPSCKHNLFALIQSKKFLVFGFGHVGICKKAQEVQIPLCPTEMHIHDEVAYSKHAARPFIF